MSFRLSPRAQSDIDEIWDYSADRWGADQADRYVSLIRDKVIEAAENPYIGRRCDEIRQGYLKVNAESHVIFYRRFELDIAVIRVLHRRMDFQRHLD